MIGKGGRYVSQQTTYSTLGFSAAQWLKNSTDVWKVVGSMPIWNSEDFFWVLFSTHIILRIKTEEPNEEENERSVRRNDSKYSKLLPTFGTECCKKKNKSSSGTDEFRNLWESKHLVKIALNLGTHVACIPVQKDTTFSSFPFPF